MVFVAHTGVEHMVTVLDVWRELPMDSVIEMRWWIVPAAEVPAGDAERIDWLFTWWAASTTGSTSGRMRPTSRRDQVRGRDSSRSTRGRSCSGIAVSANSSRWLLPSSPSTCTT